MNHQPTALELPSDAIADHDLHQARLRFGAIVHALSTTPTDARPPVPAQRPPEDEDALPTRRMNRVRRLLGRLPRPGKSRSHVRRLR